MILEQADVIDYLRECDVEKKVQLILESTYSWIEDAEIAEMLADTCQEYLTRYRKIEREEPQKE